MLNVSELGELFLPYSSTLKSYFLIKRSRLRVSASFPGMLFAGLTSLHGVQKSLFKRGEFWIGFTNCIMGALLCVINELISLVEAHLDLSCSCNLDTLFQLDIIVS